MPDLPANVEVLVEGPGRLRWAESVNDIVCCVKRWAADQQLSQDTIILFFVLCLDKCVDEGLETLASAI